MGTSRRSAYEQQLARIAQAQAEQAKKWGELARPYYEKAMKQISSQLDEGFGGLPKYVREAFEAMEGQTTEDYALAGRKAMAQQLQMLKQQGITGLNPNALAMQQGLMQENLAIQQAKALQALRMQEAMTGLQTSMELINMLKGGGLSGAQMGLGYSGQYANILQYLMSQGGGDPWGNALAGLMAGAGAGARTGSGLGAVIGALLGAYAGYRS
ncbi:MAG: hypothetical protein QXF32_03370 [Candidatus Thermoplasmatota archaeon]